MGLHGLGVNGPSLPTGWFSSGSRTYQLGTVGYGFEQVQFHTVEPVVPTQLTRLVLPHSPTAAAAARAPNDLWYRGRRRSRHYQSLVPRSPPLASLASSVTAVAAARVPLLRGSDRPITGASRTESRRRGSRGHPLQVHLRGRRRSSKSRTPWPLPFKLI